MRINNINSGFINNSGGAGKKAGVSPFGRDSVHLNSVTADPLVSKAQLAGLFKREPDWSFQWKSDPDYKNRGVSVSSDGSPYTARNNTIKKLDPENGSTLWEKEFSGMGIASSPAVEGKDGAVLVSTGDHQLVSLDPKTGNENWAYYTRIPAENVMVSPDGTIFTGNDRSLIALNRDGSEKFRFPIDDFAHEVKGFTPGGTAFAQCDRGIFAINNDGSEKWHVPGSSVELLPGDSNHVYTIQEKRERKEFSTEYEYHRELSSRDPETGNSGWKRDFGKVNIGGTADGKLFLEEEGTIHCLDVNDGKDLWSKPSDEKRAIRAVTKEGIVIAGTDKGIEALEPKTGNQLWQKDMEEKSNPSTFITEKGTILTHDKRHLMEIDPKTGDVKFRQQFQGGIDKLAFKDGRVFVTEEKDKKISMLKLTSPHLQGKTENSLNTNTSVNNTIKVEGNSVSIGGVVLPRSSI